MIKEPHVKQLEDSLDHLKQRLENLENPADLEVLDVNFEAQLDGRITEITLVTATGGPHIEIKLVNEKIVGQHGSDVRRRPVGKRQEKANEAVNRLFDFYEQQIKASNPGLK